MRFFKKNPFKKTSQVQELQLALSSAVESNSALKDQLHRAQEDKASLEMALRDADHHSQLLQENVRSTQQALSECRAMLSEPQAQNQDLHEENLPLKTSVSGCDRASSPGDRKVSICAIFDLTTHGFT